MRVLHIISSVAVGLGGVLECVRMLSEQWANAGHEVEVASLDAPAAAERSQIERRYSAVRALTFPAAVLFVVPEATR